MKYPKFFSRKLLCAAKGYCSPDESSYAQHHYNTISLINPEIKWRVAGVHLLLELNTRDIDIINKWQRKSGEKKYLLEPQSSGEHAVSLGYFMPANVNYSLRKFTSKTIKHNSSLFNDSSVSGISLSRGKVYISIYLKTSDEATALIKDIPIIHLSPKKKTLTINPLSKFYGVYQYQLVEQQAETTIKNNLSTLKSEAKNYADAILKELNLNKKVRHKSSMSLDVYIQESFINESRHEIKGYKTVIDDRIKPLSMDFSNSYHELLFPKGPYKLLDDFDYIYLREDNHSERQSFLGDLNPDFSSTYHNAINSHNIYAFLFLIQKIDKKTHENYSLTLTKKLDINKKYEKIQAISMPVNEQKKSLSTLNEHINNSGFLYYEGKQYKDYLKKYLKKIEEKTNKFEAEIMLEKEIINEVIQAKNLQYHKKYSKYVFALIIIQIIIGMLTVNWGESLRAIENQFSALFF
ncbi:hypothetical protein L2D37_14075 [Vibrio harveyi]|uniref:hypothetical protein n=1 Tax=Vibrio harveyi TaxID=669 RepID=UPI003BB7E5AC